MTGLPEQPASFPMVPTKPWALATSDSWALRKVGGTASNLDQRLGR